MSRIAIKWGGTIDKYIGDAILVFFGDPLTKGTKEDALRCVSMALEMQEKLDDLRFFWKNRGITQPLNARMGIHSGVCTVGNFGSEDRLDYTIIGNGVNLASRLESNARINQILISEDTYLLINNSVYCKKQQTMQVKGISYKIQTYEVVELKSSIENKPDVIKKNIPGLTLTFNKHEVENKKTAIKLISDVLRTLKSDK